MWSSKRKGCIHRDHPGNKIPFRIGAHCYNSDSTYKFSTVLGCLQKLLFTMTQFVFIVSLKPRLNGFVLFIKVVHVRDEILDDVHVRKWVDLGDLGVGVNFAAKYERLILRLQPSCRSISIHLMQARVLTPPMFIAHDPQMPSRQDLLKVKVGSISFLILIKASRTMGPQVFRSTSYSCIFGLSPGFSGFQR